MFALSIKNTALITKIYLHFIVVLYVFLFTQNSHSQNPLKQQEEFFSNAADAEKIYLQLSGTIFNTSETIWFKAIVTDVFNHQPTTRSGVLHVELIDPLDNRIVDENLLKISNGISNGFFQLHSSYREGKYIVRAYTEWNKNFSSDFINSIPITVYRVQSEDNKPNPIRDIVFTKDLASNEFSLSSIVDVKQVDSLHTGEAILYIDWKGNTDSVSIKPKRNNPSIKIQHKVPLDVPIINYRLQTKNEVFTKSIVLDDEYGSLRFFPEGGSLVDGLQSSVGFKYTDFRGMGSEVKGTIEDGDNTIIAELKSNALGLGKVILIPEAGKTYYGVLTTESGHVFKYVLPKVKKSGLVLSLIRRGPNKELKIWSKVSNSDSFFVKFFHRGKNLFYLKARFVNGMFSCTIKPKDVPHGVIGLTIYDKYFKPVAERHFFNKWKDDSLNINMEMASNQHLIRDSVKVSISTGLNGRPVPASVSVIAVDSSYFYGTNLERNTIVSYFLLQSDIKGTVENPSYYFKNDKNLAELDYLMLTQGWTNYKYKEKKQPKTFGIEKGLEVKGTVVNIDRKNGNQNQASKQYELNMLLMGEPLEIYTKETDSVGNFRFQLGDSYGLGRKFVMQHSDASSTSEKLKINIEKHEVPEIVFETENIIVPVDNKMEMKVQEKMEKDIKLDPFLLPNTIALGEVVVMDYKITPERAEMVKLHGIPDVVIDNKELISKRKKWTRDLYRWLLFNYPREIKVKRVPAGFELAYVYGAEWTYVVIDGMPVHEQDYGLIGNIPVSTIKNVEIIRNTSSANKYHSQVFNCAPMCPPPAFPAILAIYTYVGEGIFGAFPKTKKTNLINDTAPQFSAEREYYVPEYHEPSKIDWDIADRRSLLYWAPNIMTNEKGQTVTTFFNSDITGKMVIICEGITSNGKVGYSKLFYEVNDP